MNPTLYLLLIGLGISGDSPVGDHSTAHWAFQSVHRPDLPAAVGESQSRSPIDRYIRAKLRETGLQMATPADRNTLIRRATYDITGLVPTAAEIDQWINDESPDAFDTVIDRLLASPRFGERWGRFWLDVARYADTKGYIFTEERKFPYSYTYRDWVIRSLNDDLPYDRFVTEQLAADLLEHDGDKSSLAALGFLTLGRRFLGNTHDIIDDRIDVVTRGTMAITVQCARCHDHKYDPIPQADYYSLYGVFASCTDKELAIAPATAEFDAELHKREGELNEFQESTLERTLHKLRTKVSDYLLATESLKDHPDIQEFMFVENPGDINRFALGRWRTYLEVTAKKPSDVWSIWNALAALPEAEFSARAPDVVGQLLSGGGGDKSVHPLIAREFAGEPVRTIKDSAERYGRVFTEVELQWQEQLKQAKAAGRAAPSKFDDPNLEQIRQVLYGTDSPTAVPRRRVDDLFEKPDADKLRALRKSVQDWRTSPQAPPNAMALVDNDTPVNPAVFVRGNPANRGATVPRQFLAVLSGTDRKPFGTGSGRLDLARAIANPSNPLTARVYVNRVWLHLFGSGLVRTPSDFGMRSDPPSHPELLDWLADWFVNNGWSTKRLIRLIMQSDAYQQSSGSFTESVAGESNADQKSLHAASIDPENRLLWRQNRRRLDFESMRDALLAVAGDVDWTVGGPAVDLTKQPFSRRRTVYGFIERQNLPGMLRTFDFASPDTHCPQRFNTTVPQQALFLMNSPFVIEQATRVGRRSDIQAQNDPALRLQRMYRDVIGRPATREEIELGLAFIQSISDNGQSSGRPHLDAWEQLAQVLLLSNEFLFVD